MPASLYNITTDQIYQEYQIPATGTASAAQFLNYSLDQRGMASSGQKLIITARGDNIIVALGNTSAVAASKTLTNNALPAGMFSVDSGTVFEVSAHQLAQTYLSCIAQTSSGTLVVRLAKSNS